MFKRGDFVQESTSRGVVLISGPTSFDIVWIGGSTSRYRHGTRVIRLMSIDELSEMERKHLTDEAERAREERRTGARIKRGQVWPSR